MGIPDSTIPASDCAVKTFYVLTAIFALAALLIFWRPVLGRGPASPKLKAYFAGFFAVAVFVFLPAHLGGIFFALAMTALIGECLWEFLGMLNLGDMAAYRRLGLAFAPLMVAAVMFSSHGDLAAWLPACGSGWAQVGQLIFYLVPLAAAAAAAILPVCTGDFSGCLTKGAATVFGITYVGWFLAHVMLIRALPNGFGYFIFLCMAVALNDILAYVIGKRFGKHALAPTLSPGKTWEGACGGMVGTIACACLFRYAVIPLDLVHLIVVTVSIAVAAPIGDLTISAVKRDMNVKDCGSLVPGTGGLLDRCDSAILSSPLLYYYLLFVVRP